MEAISKKGCWSRWKTREEKTRGGGWQYAVQSIGMRRKRRRCRTERKRSEVKKRRK